MRGRAGPKNAPGADPAGWTDLSSGTTRTFALLNYSSSDGLAASPSQPSQIVSKQSRHWPRAPRTTTEPPQARQTRSQFEGSRIKDDSDRTEVIGDCMGAPCRG